MKWLAFLIVGAMYAQPAIAQQISPASLRLSKAFVSDSIGQTYRRQYGTALLDYCESLAAKVPRNTPAEATWVEKEMMDSIRNPGPSLQRWSRLEISTEYSRYVIRTTLEKCAEILKSMASAKNTREEAALWSDLAWQLSSVDDFQKAARILGLFSDSADPDLIETFRVIHQAILGKILSPMLRE
jgi:hypothetical protein